MTDEMSSAEYVAQMAGKKGNKYAAQPVEEDGYRFASKAEHRRYRQLKLLVQGGAIRDLEVHPVYQLTMNGQKVGRYTADFRYVDRDRGEVVVEDVKGGSRGSYSEAYRLRKRLVKAQYGIEIQEIAA